MKRKQAKKIEQLLVGIDIDVTADDLLEIADSDELTEFLDENGYFDVDIIYHSRALEYLAEHDPSLQYSCGIASDMGYEVKNINSELLASLLARENLRESYDELTLDIMDILG